MKKQPKILIVDDIETNIDILIGVLSDKYELLVAIDGESALEIVKNEKIDLILLDISMPIMDGYELCEILKSNKRTRNIPVIFVTANSDDESIKKAFEVGGIDYITKPYRPIELKAKIKTQIDIEGLKRREIEYNKELKRQVKEALSDLHNAQKLAKIGSWQYEIENNKLILDDESYNIFEIDKNIYPNLSIKNYLDLISIEDGFPFFEAYNKHLTDKSTYLTVHRIITHNGKLKYVEERCETIFDENNHPIVSKGTIQDVTEQKEIQLKLEQNDKQMILQSRYAQMGEMIGMIAHQWRQPLTAISSRTNNLIFKLMMGKELELEMLKKELEHIGEYSQHLSKTIDDFRGFFKENKIKEKTTLKDIVISTLDIIQAAVENKNIKIVTDFNCGVEFETYPSELKQVVLNIIKNSEDVLLDKGIEEPTIIIKTFCNKDGGNQTMIIKDNGGGIPKEIMDKIFEPYFSTKLTKDGTGLGLYMSKTIVEDHCGGKLIVSNGEAGAVFMIVL